MKKNQHVVPHEGRGWAVIGEKNEKVTKVTKTQKEAIDYAQKIAQNQKVELVIHRKDGTIRDKDSYGNDNCPPKDTKY